MRSALLWAAQNRWLRRRVPRLPFVRRAVRQFLPGETLDAGLSAAQDFARRGLPTTLSHLGENVTAPNEAAEATRQYLEVLRRVAELGLDAEISVKLTHLGLDLDPDLAFANLAQLLEWARELSNWVWVDIESSQYVEGTIELYRRALGVSPRVGLCLQAYLHRTAEDIESLLPLRPSIRLVKGAYREPPEIAIRKKKLVDDSFAKLSRRLLEAVKDGSLVRFAAATHDLRLIARIEEMRRQMGLPREAFEVQMLYGIRQGDQFRLVGEGYKVRSLIAYGPAWYPWYMRRLAERPANALFVLRNVFGRPPVRV